MLISLKLVLFFICASKNVIICVGMICTYANITERVKLSTSDCTKLMTEPDRKGGVGVHKCLQNFLQNLVTSNVELRAYI